MRYISTRGNNGEIYSAEAIVAGLAKDGGLFVPESFPEIDTAFIQDLVNLSYIERAEKVLELFLSDFYAEEIADCVTKAYGDNKFDSSAVAPVKMFDDINVLELWHGPTSAFKDMALQLLPQLMGTALKKTGEKQKILILVATSGDTGKAALAGFKDVPQIKIQVFYPDGGVSKMQRLQMVTQTGDNVSVVAVKGNFDDAQNGVKKIFGDKSFNEKLNTEGVKLSSANSINWGRLVPQIVYYFSAYADLVRGKKIKIGEEINFTVPTGNFGNILAGFYAKCMGLPVSRLVCASNKNNVLTDFISTGKYTRNREFFKTITPSMDILISSNLERLLYHVSGEQKKVEAWMRQLQENGCYDVGPEVLKKIDDIFWSDWVDDFETSATIKQVYKERKYILDPHTAVAWATARAYQQETGDKKPMVVVSTASPYKFNDDVLKALEIDVDKENPFINLDKLEGVSDIEAPAGLSGLRCAKVLHDTVCQKEEMADIVIDFARK